MKHGQDAGPTIRPAGRLARYDRFNAQLGLALPAIKWFLGIAYFSAAAAVLVWSLTRSPGAQSGRALTRLHDAQIAPIMTTAATIGGLALTVFFWTAQHRALTGIEQYGVAKIYRNRTVLPLLGLTGTTVIAGLFRVLAGDSGSLVISASAATALATLSDFFLVLFVVVLACELVLNMDPVSIARRFAREIRGADAAEWGLIRVDFTAAGSPSIAVQSHRANFGLRDPLMPVHEILMSTSSPQRYAQIVGVLTARIAREYSVRWDPQFPDVTMWPESRSDLSAWRRLRRWLREWGSTHLQTPARQRRRARTRLQLVGLILHYLRRVHRNSDSAVSSPGNRRNPAQFSLARLFVLLLVNGPQDGSRRPEMLLVLHLILDAIWRVGADFAPGAKFYETAPVRSQRIAEAVVHSVASAQSSGLPDLAVDAARVLLWIDAADPDELRPISNRYAFATEGARKAFAHFEQADVDDLLRVPQFICDGPWREFDEKGRPMWGAWVDGCSSGRRETGKTTLQVLQSE